MGQNFSTYKYIHTYIPIKTLNVPTYKYYPLRSGYKEEDWGMGERSGSWAGMWALIDDLGYFSYVKMLSPLSKHFIKNQTPDVE